MFCDVFALISQAVHAFRRSPLYPPMLIILVRNHIIVRNTVHGVASGPSRPFSIAKYFFRLARGGLRFSDFHLCILFLHFPSFPIYVRKCFSWSRRCVCPTVFQGAAAGRYTLGTPREIFEFQFCECDSVNEIW